MEKWENEEIENMHICHITHLLTHSLTHSSITYSSSSESELITFAFSLCSPLSLSVFFQVLCFGHSTVSNILHMNLASWRHEHEQSSVLSLVSWNGSSTHGARCVGLFVLCRSQHLHATANWNFSAHVSPSIIAKWAVSICLVWCFVKYSIFYPFSTSIFFILYTFRTFLWFG